MKELAYQLPASTSRRHYSAIIVALAAFGVSSAVVLILGAHRPLESDAPFFLSIAENLAREHSFVNSLSPWATIPASDRMPAWPFFVSIFIALLPHAEPNLIIRLAGIILHAATATTLTELTFRLSRRQAVALTTGLAYALYPSALFLVDQGMSEPLFVFILILALLALVSGWVRTAAALSGLCCLVRPNFLIVPILLVIVWRIFATETIRAGLGGVWTAAVCAGLFVAPTGAWTARNYFVTGHFPVISTIQGLTLYGANNEVVANSLEYWGYWVQPDQVGGPERRTLARQMSPYELDRYYTRMAVEYWHHSWFCLPRLILGKLVRAFVPIPWNASWAGYAASGCRLILYALFLSTMRYWARVAGRQYILALSAIFLMSLITTVIYYGTARFTFMMEAPMFPCAIAGLWARLESARLGSARELVDATSYRL